MYEALPDGQAVDAAEPGAEGIGTGHALRGHLRGDRHRAPPAVVCSCSSDLDYPGWRAAIDGAPARIVRADRGLRGVALPAGRHRVTFTFAPRSVRIGAWLTLASARRPGRAGLDRPEPVLDALTPRVSCDRGNWKMSPRHAEGRAIIRRGSPQEVCVEFVKQRRHRRAARRGVGGHERRRALARVDRVGHERAPARQGTAADRQPRADPAAALPAGGVDGHDARARTQLRLAERDAAACGSTASTRSSRWAHGTRATLRLTYDGVLARLMGRLTRGITNRYLDMEASGLKRRSEENARAAVSAS